MKSALARSLLTHGRTDCNDRLAAFAARQPLIFIQFSPLFARLPAWSISLHTPPSGRRTSNHRHQSVTGGAEGGGGRGRSFCGYLHRLIGRSDQDMTTVRNLAASERGGIDRRHAVAAADNEGSDRRGETRGKSDKFRLDPR